MGVSIRPRLFLLGLWWGRNPINPNREIEFSRVPPVGCSFVPRDTCLRGIIPQRYCALVQWGALFTLDHRNVPSLERSSEAVCALDHIEAALRIIKPNLDLEETVAEKPAYRVAFKARPCLVVTDGFYEWAKVGPKEKQPYFITTKGRAPFAFAGLWEWWRAKEAPKDEPGLETFTILTTEQNET